MEERNHKNNATIHWLLTCSLAITLLYGSAVSASTLLGEVIQSSTPAENSAYGYSLSISGDTAAVGEWFDTGVVNILKLNPDTGSWQEVQKIQTPEAQRGQVNFGFSTWLDGDQLVVGAPTILTSRPGGISGYAYIYERDSDDGSWVLARSIAGKFAAEDEFPDGRLGREVVIDQGQAMISRQNDDDTSNILIYEEDLQTGQWVEWQSLDIGGAGDSNTGADIVEHNITALALDNDRLVVGVGELDVNGEAAFAVRIFELDESQNTWIEADRIDQFSTSIDGSRFPGVALDNAQILITGNEGAFLFQRDAQNGLWSEDNAFRTDTTSDVSRERQASDIEGSRAIIVSRDGTGVLVYERDGISGRWSVSAELSTALLNENDPTVTAVDLQGDHVLVGVPYFNSFTGAVLAFRLDDPDSDGIAAVDDNCPLDFNPTQANFDEDLLGDACDLDDDNDNVDDDSDAFPFDPNRQDAVNADSGEAPVAPFPVWPFGDGISLATDFRWPAVANASFYVIEVQHGESIRAYEPMIPAITACNATQCEYVKTDAAVNGFNRWRLRAGNSAGISDWSPWTDFFVGQSNNFSGGSTDNVAAFNVIPAVPIPQQPSDVSSASNVDFVWAAVPGVVRYSIEVQHQGSIRAYEPSIPSTGACTNGVCRYVKTDAARPGENRWRLRAINDVGASEWSDWTNFTLRSGQSATNENTEFVPSVPSVPSPISSPSNAVASVMDYRWGEVTGASLYSVEIQHNGQVRGYADDILSSEVCSSSDCVFSKDDAALPGDNRWRVRSGNTEGFSEWSEWQTFVR